MIKKTGLRISVLVSGTAISQLIYLCALPLISRLYSAEVIGTYGTVIAAITVLAVACSMKFELTILERDAEGNITYVTSMMFSLIMFMVVGPISFFYSNIWLDLGVGVSAVVAFCPLAVAFYNINVNKSVKTKNFGGVSASTILRVAVCCVLQIGFFFIASGSLLALLLGYFLSFVIGQLMLAKINNKSEPFVIESFDKYLKVIFSKRDVPIYAGSQALLNAISQALPYIILPLFVSPAFMGLYFYADRVFRMPLMLVGQPIRQVFHSFCSNSGSYIKIRQVFLLLCSLGGFSAIAITAFLFTFGERAFGAVFGNEFSNAGDIAAWLGLWGIGAFISFPALAFLRSEGMNRFIMKLEIVFLPLKGLSLLSAGLLIQRYGLSPLYIISGFSVTSMFVGGVLFLKAMLMLNNLVKLERLEQQVC